MQYLLSLPRVPATVISSITIWPSPEAEHMQPPNLGLSSSETKLNKPIFPVTYPVTNYEIAKSPQQMLFWAKKRSWLQPPARRVWKGNSLIPPSMDVERLGPMVKNISARLCGYPCVQFAPRHKTNHLLTHSQIGGGGHLLCARYYLTLWDATVNN